MGAYPALYQGDRDACQLGDSPQYVCHSMVTRLSTAAERAAYEAPCERLSPDAEPRVLLVADHASNALPASYASLGLPEASFARHIAYDLGIADLVRQLAGALQAPAVLAGFSRLLIDPNRGEDDPSLVMRLSDGEIVPGNAMAGAAEIARRVAEFHRPYHVAIDAALDRALAARAQPLLISLHSFTPVWRGRARPWQCGILSSGDRATADQLLAALRADRDLLVGDNEPYSGDLEGDCMDRHGTRRGIAHGLIEIRQDLIATPAGRASWVRRLAAILAPLIGALRR
jgi:predicted N-formylglutamate amidohydrolase